MNRKEFFRPTLSKVVFFIVLEGIHAFLFPLFLLGIFRLFFVWLMIATISFANYALTCLVFYKKNYSDPLYYLLFPLSTIALAILVTLSQYLGLQYCYTANWGTHRYHEIPNKQCVCKGWEIYDCPLGARCDGGSSMWCLGRVKGIYYGVRTGAYRTLDDWENACKQRYIEDKNEGGEAYAEKMKKYYMRSIIETKFAEWHSIFTSKGVLNVCPNCDRQTVWANYIVDNNFENGIEICRSQKDETKKYNCFIGFVSLIVQHPTRGEYDLKKASGVCSKYLSGKKKEKCLTLIK